MLGVPEEGAGALMGVGEGKVFLGERPLLQGFEGCVRVLWLGQPDPLLLTSVSPSLLSPVRVQKRC